MKLLSRSAARALDVELMSPAYGYALAQLMELAGLSVACAIASTYPVGSHPRILAVCGPGNNGGDALVAARHLKFFGYDPSVVYPKQPDKEPFTGLVKQMEMLDIPFLETFPEGDDATSLGFDVILDGVFGFSFDSARPIRAPFDAILQRIRAVSSSGSVPVAAIDIPSGWDVEKGPISELDWQPDLLVSLTAPKECARFFGGPHHFVGGRFVPPAISKKYALGTFAYQGTDQCFRLDTSKLCESAE